jgi:hypothetical protein
VPRYFFHLNDGDDHPDVEGTEFDGPTEARAQAVVALGEMLRDIDGKFWDGEEWRMTVVDWQGRTVAVLRCSGDLG